jgi:phage shock protein A
MPIRRVMFGRRRSRARLAVAAVVCASFTVPGTAYGLAAVTATPATATPATTTPATTAPAPTTTIPGPPPEMPTFGLPTNSGIELLQAMQKAKADLKAARDGMKPAKQAVATAERRAKAAQAEVKKLEAQQRRTQKKLDDTRALLKSAAVQAYIHAGDAQLTAAISSFLSTTSIVDAGSQLHVIGTFGSNTKALLDEFIELKQRVDAQLAHIRDVSKRAADRVQAAKRHVADLQHAIEDAQRRIAVTLAGMHDFATAATSATSPILGPSRLTAKQMADYVVAQHYKPRITVPIEVLAQIYLNEGVRTGVRGDVAFAQSILETGGFANPGSAATDNNFAGIGWCDTCKHGFDFPDAATGVRAQLQLLRIYVDPDFPEAGYKDKILLPGTLKLGFRGKVQTWWDLWGTWATGSLYGQRVYDIYERMVVFAASDPTPPPAPAKTPAASKPAAPKAPAGTRKP